MVILHLDTAWAMAWVMAWVMACMVWVMAMGECTMTIMECTQGIMVVITEDIMVVIMAADFLEDILYIQFVKVTPDTEDRIGQAICHQDGIVI
jgi:hypothetical protein